MPEFSSPFKGNVPKMMNPEELVRAIRLDLSAEQEAVSLYETHAAATENPAAKKVLLSIAEEERVHIGEFNHLLELLTGDEQNHLARGAGEVDALLAKGRRVVEPIKDERIVPEGLQHVKITPVRDDPYYFEMMAEVRGGPRIQFQGWETEGIYWVSIFDTGKPSFALRTHIVQILRKFPDRVIVIDTPLKIVYEIRSGNVHEVIRALRAILEKAEEYAKKLPFYSVPAR